MRLPRIIVVGLGFCGLTAAYEIKKALKEKAQVIGINNTPLYAYIPSLHNFAVGKTSQQKITIDLPKALKKRGIEFFKGELKSIDNKQNQIIIKSGEKLPYDYLVLCTGSENNYFGNKNFQENSLGLRWLSDALKIQLHLKKFEWETAKENFDKNWLNFVIVGGGITGVELAGELHDCFVSINKKRSKKLKPDIYLVHSQDRLLPGYSQKAQTSTQKYLEKIGIKLILNNRAQDIQKNKVILSDGQTIEANTIIWASGLAPSNAIKELPFEHDQKGNILLEDTMQLAGCKNIFAGGDTFSFKNDELNKQSPKTAQQAEYQGSFIACNLSNLIRGKKLKKYGPKTNPVLISLGDRMGFITYKNITIFSFWFSFAKKALEWWYLFCHR